MSLNGSAQFATANAFRRSLEDRLKKEAALRSKPLNQLRREFVFQRFLSLLFASGDAQWVIKGGGSLLIRLPDARHSRDLDLLRLGEITAADAVAELRALTAPREGDHLTFQIADTVTESKTNPVLEIKVTAYVGAQYDDFPIDLARELHFIATPERVIPNPVIDVPGMPDPPEMTVYPLTDQIADKVCAMYERHGDQQRPSTRYRDLVDLALIVTTSELPAEPIIAALNSEAERRGLTLPAALIEPDPIWVGGFAGIAKKTKLHPQYHDLASCLDLVGGCLNSLLSGERTRGLWSPATGWIG